MDIDQFYELALKQYGPRVRIALRPHKKKRIAKKWRKRYGVIDATLLKTALESPAAFQRAVNEVRRIARGMLDGSIPVKPYKEEITEAERRTLPNVAW